MCEKCDQRAANVPADVLEGMTAQADALIVLFKKTADMNFGPLAGGDLFQVVVQIAAKTLAESLHTTFGDGRRKLSAELEAKVLPKYLTMADCFAARERASRATQKPGKA